MSFTSRDARAFVSPPSQRRANKLLVDPGAGDGGSAPGHLYSEEQDDLRGAVLALIVFCGCIAMAAADFTDMWIEAIR